MMQTSRSIVFSFSCRGSINNWTRLMMYKSGQTTKPFREVCVRTRIRVVYFNYKNVFELNSNNTMKKYPSWLSIGSAPRAEEILSTFFTSESLAPTWIDCKGDIATYNKTLDKWTGAVGEVSQQLFLNTHSWLRMSWSWLLIVSITFDIDYSLLVKTLIKIIIIYRKWLFWGSVPPHKKYFEVL